MHRLAVCIVLFVFSLPAFSVETVPEIWEDFYRKTENADCLSYSHVLDDMIFSLDELLADSSFLYVRDQNPELFSLVNQLRNLAD